ncbi:hypothetical protein BD289DRAFT_61255 [Coniella lustricola]|uniref:Uncharacterized protein n=1 Tax=Coniella lustricola TaxID=2025994 RepID=A0A2T3A0G5_9PEZI|nr:hypothetical protein BD289DRAFT_61255 [Coniella lustricola]
MAPIRVGANHPARTPISVTDQEISTYRSISRAIAVIIVAGYMWCDPRAICAVQPAPSIRWAASSFLPPPRVLRQDQWWRDKSTCMAFVTSGSSSCCLQDDAVAYGSTCVERYCQHGNIAHRHHSASRSSSSSSSFAGALDIAKRDAANWGFAPQDAAVLGMDPSFVCASAEMRSGLLWDCGICHVCTSAAQRVEEHPTQRKTRRA